MWEESSIKEQWCLPALLSQRKLPLQLLLKPDNLVPPCMSLVLFELLFFFFFLLELRVFVS